MIGSKPRGMFFLQRAEDLFQKLEWDCERIAEDPLDACACFNFFVTAEHLPEWIFAANPSAAQHLRRNEPLLRVCSQLANGAKHFEATDQRHRSVVATSVQSVVSLQTDEARCGQGFVVHLAPEEAHLLGHSTMGVLKLATEILALLKARLDEACI